MSPDKTTEATLRFSWIIDNALAASARPGRYGPLDDHIGFLRRSGVKTVINLCEDTVGMSDGNGASFDVVHVPILDGEAPSEEQLKLIMAAIENALGGGGPCLVHCRGGVGRTATVLAPVLMKFRGMDLEQALELLRQSGRRTETMQQYRFLEEWQKRNMSAGRGADK